MNDYDFMNSYDKNVLIDFLLLEIDLLEPFDAYYKHYYQDFINDNREDNIDYKYEFIKKLKEPNLDKEYLIDFMIRNSFIYTEDKDEEFTDTYDNDNNTEKNDTKNFDLNQNKVKIINEVEDIDNNDEIIINQVRKDFKIKEMYTFKKSDLIKYLISEIDTLEPHGYYYRFYYNDLTSISYEKDENYRHILVSELYQTDKNKLVDFMVRNHFICDKEEIEKVLTYPIELESIYENISEQCVIN